MIYFQANRAAEQGLCRFFQDGRAVYVWVRKTALGSMRKE
jgi:hypothetical protein